MLLRYEYQIDAKCNLIFGFFWLHFRKRKKNLNWKWTNASEKKQEERKPTLQCAILWCLIVIAVFLSMNGIDIEKRSQCSNDDDDNEPKLNVCFHNDHITSKNEMRERECSSVSVAFAAVAVHQKWIKYCVGKHETHTCTEGQSDTLSQRRRFQCNLLF